MLAPNLALVKAECEKELPFLIRDMHTKATKSDKLAHWTRFHMRFLFFLSVNVYGKDGVSRIYKKITRPVTEEVTGLVAKVRSVADFFTLYKIRIRVPMPYRSLR